MQAERFYQALLYEIRKEQAASLGRAGERLAQALAQYHTRTSAEEPLEPSEQEALIAAVTRHVWALAVQRELMGLHHENLAWIAEVYEVPALIRHRLGLTPPVSS
jgi:hypothetical protein